MLRTFFVLTFAISWGIPGVSLLVAGAVEGLEAEIAPYSLLYYVGVWGPAIAALIVVGRRSGAAGVHAYLARLKHWRAGVGPYLGVLLGIPLLYLLAASITEAFGADGLAWPPASWSALVLLAVLAATAGPLEEIGWRGYALPLLQRRFGGLAAALVLGAVWGLWHLPLYLGELAEGDVSGFAVFFGGVVALSVVMSVLYNASGGCLPLAMLTHWMANLPYPWEGEADLFPAQNALMALLAIALVLAPTRRWLEVGRLETEPLPDQSKTRSPVANAR